MSDPSADDERVIRQKVYEEQLTRMVREAIDDLRRLGDRLESHIESKIELETTLDPGQQDGDGYTYESPDEKA